MPRQRRAFFQASSSALTVVPRLAQTERRSIVKTEQSDVMLPISAQGIQVPEEARVRGIAFTK